MGLKEIKFIEFDFIFKFSFLFAKKSLRSLPLCFDSKMEQNFFTFNNWMIIRKKKRSNIHQY